MASQTTNLELVLPAGNENVSREVINGNMEILDGAFGELDERIDYVAQTLLYGFLITQEFTCTYSMAANEAKTFTQADFSFSVPNGYEIVGIASFSSGSDSASVCYVQPGSSSYFMLLRSSAAVSSKTARVTVLFAREVNVPT